ncbi:MAG: DNA-3-methyladenine glycosylase [Solirubrobacteraceae bacterium]|nr:DNA-3-methyladenine glycosylase [Patulibacter sp.]
MGHREELAALGAIEPSFADAIRTWGEPPERLRGRPGHGSRFASLARSVTGQQFSVASAAAIYGRVVDLLGGEPTPEGFLAHTETELRAVGLSGAKARTLQGLSRAILDGVVDLDALDDLPEDQAQAALVALPGIGPWTAQLFLMFVLGRPDVLAAGDVAIRNGIAKIFDLPVRPTEKELVVMAEPWSPHRTAACLIAWHVLRATPLPAEG